MRAPVPSWIWLCLDGRNDGRDGRVVLVKDADGFMASSLAGGGVPVDINHAGDDSVGRIVALQVRDGAIWGRVEWTERGRRAVAGKEYAYVSPHFDLADDGRTAIKLLGVAITNDPNAYNSAIARNSNSKGGQPVADTSTLTDAQRRICESFGVSEQAFLEAREGQKQADYANITSYDPLPGMKPGDTRVRVRFVK